MKKICKCKQAHGAKNNSNDLLESCFVTSKMAIASKDLDNMSLLELQDIADSLDLVVSDNRSDLIKNIQKRIK